MNIYIHLQYLIFPLSYKRINVSEIMINGCQNKHRLHTSDFKLIFTFQDGHYLILHIADYASFNLLRFYPPFFFVSDIECTNVFVTFNSMTFEILLPSGSKYADNIEMISSGIKWTE